MSTNHDQNQWKYDFNLDTAWTPSVSCSESRTIVLLDCSNLNQAAKKFGQSFRYEALLKHFGTPIDARCFLVEDRFEATTHRSKHYLESLGFIVRTKELRYFTKSKSGDFDVEIALEMAHIAYYEKEVTRVVLASGDGHFEPAVKLLQSCHIEVWGLAFVHTLSRKLKMSLDKYIPVGPDFLCLS